jgi:dihydrofolate reductase
MEESSQYNMKIALVVAIAQDGAIGAGGDLLWRLPADMKYFKEVKKRIFE